jgi:WD40 repeat protein
LAVGVGFAVNALTPPAANFAAAPLPPFIKPKESPLPAEVVAQLGTNRFRTGGNVNHLAVSAKGDLLATSTSNNQVLVWKADTGELVHRLEHNVPVASAQFSRDGKRIVTYANIVYIWDLQSGQRERVIEAKKTITAVAITPDDRNVVVAVTGAGAKEGDGLQGHLELRELATDRLVRTFGEHRHYISRLEFLPGGQLLTFSELESRDRTAQLRRFDFATGELKAEMVIDGWTRWSPFSGQVSTDGKLLVTVQGGLKAWDLETGKHLGTSAKEAGPYDGWIVSPDCARAVFSMTAKNGVGPNGQVMEVEPRRLIMWDAEQDREICRIDPSGTLAPLAILPGNTVLITTNYSGTLQRWNVASGKEIEPLESHADSISYVAFSHDNERIATIDDQSVFIWETRTGKRLTSFRFGKTTNMRRLCWTPDGKTLITGGYNDLHFWDTATGKAKAPGKLPIDFGSYRLSPDGATLATISERWWFMANPPPGEILLWDWAKAKTARTLTRPDKDLIQSGPLAFAPQGRWLATSALQVRLGPPKKVPIRNPLPDGDDVKNPAPKDPPPQFEIVREPIPTPPRIQVWDLETGKVARDWDATDLHLVVLEYTADGKTLLGGFQNGVACLWDAKTGKERARFKHEAQGPFNFMSAISPDGQHVVTAEHGANLLRFWDVGSKKIVADLRVHHGPIRCLTFSGDGSLLAAASTDTTTLVIDVAKVLKRLKE